MAEHAPPSAGEEVLVIGEAVMDLVSSRGEITRSPGGSPVNVALGLARLGVRTRVRTALAADDDGRVVLDRLEASGVLVDPASISLPRTSTALAELDSHGAARYAFDVEWRVTEPIATGSARVVHAGSIALFLQPGAAHVTAALSTRPAGVLVSIDPNVRPAIIGDRADARLAFDRYVELADVVKLSDEDAAWLYPGEAPESVLDRLLGAGVSMAALTRGREGAVIATPMNRVVVESLPVDVRDTVGAGDSFMAALLAGLLRSDTPVDAVDEADLERIGTFAAAAAAVTVGRVGADLPSDADIALLRRTAAIERCTTGSIGTVVW
ncbi:carbohydrate kinase family protein [Agromyces ramosus]|uniref:Fructokinase n=1 Tax=Agromyces ramosus TaxID=33879 RepID=A0ABU0R610_9MICO|nr:carbohydrate kinase [Agromyces ramosus]MDQ0893522.1 fructokinase [Agromyces ramosus]